MTDPTPQTTTRDEAVLLPCPFCGGRAMRAPSVSSYDATEVDGCRIKCASDGCPVDGKSFYGEAAYDQAVAWWNCRAHASGGMDAVKPLEWRMAKPDGDDQTAYADAVTGDYTAFAFRSLRAPRYMVFGWQRRHGEDVHVGSFEEAKAAAQADYEQRIRSALSPAATPVSEAGPDWMEAQQVRKRRGVEIMQEYAWGNLTPLGVANHLKRAGFNIDYAQKIANDLAKPASSPAGGGVHEAAIGLLSELDAYCVGSRAYDRRVNEARRALKAALSQSTSAGRVGE